jgi:hypothetical protein
MSCKKHLWDFHAELSDGTIVRWCGQCGGLQTYAKPSTCNLGLDQVGFTQYAPTEVRLPEMVKEDDGLYSEGVVSECQPELRSLYSNHRWSKFSKPWTPDDDGEVVRCERPQTWVDDPAREMDLQELQVLSGVQNTNECKGK